jgi:hypothetical protein
VVVDRAVK